MNARSGWRWWRTFGVLGATVAVVVAGVAAIARPPRRHAAAHAYLVRTSPARFSRTLADVRAPPAAA